MMSSTSDKKSNFFFANCLQCEGIIRIPITIRPDSAVSCPHCSSQFDLIAYLDQIPEVSVSEATGNAVSGSAADSDEFQIDTGEGIEKQDGKYIVPPQIAAGMRKKRRGRRRRSSSSDSASSSQMPNHSQAAASASSASSKSNNAQLSEAEELKLARREDRSRREREKLKLQREAAALREEARRAGRSGSRSRTRKPEVKRSPLLEATKIIVGGLLAAPIAYLLLMWGFSRDPMGIVPTIYKVAPVLVPGKLILDNDEDFIPDVEINGGPSDDILAQPEFEDGLRDFEDVDIYESDIEIP